MTDGLRHLDTALELGRQLGRGEKVRLTKECPRCEGSGKLQVWDYKTPDGAGRVEVCPDCKGTGRIPA
ncbi:hypothetical protein KAW64_06095 [bacterium]|nr:hypothetical protein [bacterium]